MRRTLRRNCISHDPSFAPRWTRSRAVYCEGVKQWLPEARYCRIRYVPDTEASYFKNRSNSGMGSCGSTALPCTWTTHRFARVCRRGSSAHFTTKPRVSPEPRRYPPCSCRVADVYLSLWPRPAVGRCSSRSHLCHARHCRV